MLIRPVVSYISMIELEQRRWQAARYSKSEFCEEDAKGEKDEEDGEKHTPSARANDTTTFLTTPENFEANAATHST